MGDSMGCSVRWQWWWWLQALSLLSLSALFSTVHCQQYFLTEPEDAQVLAGGTVLLKCKVGDKAGMLQWVKDGFALGEERIGPGFPRYTLTGDRAANEYNLQIADANLRDDAEFQCQVGPPSPIGSHAARVTILLPPDDPTIEGYNSGVGIPVTPSEGLQLTCRCNNGKPAASLTWYRNGEEVTEGVSYSTEPTGTEKRENAVNVLQLQPTDDDNGARYECRASHATLDATKNVFVTLSVQYPPGEPVITGFETQPVKKVGDLLQLTCTSEGGNPLADLIWYKNDQRIDSSYHTVGNQALNELIHTVVASDNNAEFSCQASNGVTSTPLKTSITLTVKFPPTEVTISGYEQGLKAGDAATLVCTSANSNPAAVLTWWTGGRQLGSPQTSASAVTAVPEGGFVTQQNLTIDISANDNKVIYTCQAVNEDLPGASAVTTNIRLDVQYPPDEPYISGYEEGTIVRAGRLQRMTCIAAGGNPEASLVWLKNGQVLSADSNSITYSISGNIASSELSIIAEASDNNAVYSCNASNPATSQPLSATKVLTVQFPPERVTITTNPPVLKAGEQGTLSCTSSSSNPASVVTWYRDGKVQSGTVEGRVPAENGGFSTTNALTIQLTSGEDGTVFSCRATNQLLSESVNDAITLDVNFAPEFPVSESTPIVNATEGKDAVINSTASANPATVDYRWFRDGVELTGVRQRRQADGSRYIIVGGALIIKNVTRNDRGNYVCQASNDLGSTDRTLFLNVQYPAEIADITDHRIVDIGGSAQFFCTGVGNPTPTNFVTWAREGANASRLIRSYSDLTATLSINDITKDDKGDYKCVANNGIPPAAVQTSRLLVRFAPELDKSPLLSRVAAGEGDTANLVCKAEGFPDVQFSWFKGSELLNTSGNRLQSTVRMKSWYQREGILIIHNVSASQDYSTYRCQVTNSLGTDTFNVRLDGRSKPDMPTSVTLVKKEDTSVTLSWTPGFDGGVQQSFQIRYNKQGRQGFVYVDVTPPNATTYTVTGLDPNTAYEFAVTSINSLGESDYLPLDDPVLTSESSGIAGPAGGISREVIIGVAVAGALCLLLNIILIVFLVRWWRRRRKARREAAKKDEDAATLETVDLPNGVLHLNDLSPDNYGDIIKNHSPKRPLDPYEDEHGEPYSDFDLQEALDKGNYYHPDPTLYRQDEPYNYERYRDDGQPGVHWDPFGKPPPQRSSPALGPIYPDSAYASNYSDYPPEQDYPPRPTYPPTFDDINPGAIEQDARVGIPLLSAEATPRLVDDDGTINTYGLDYGGGAPSSRGSHTSRGSYDKNPYGSQAPNNRNYDHYDQRGHLV
ncbi:PREDICTED: nephrin-like isoform X2 [Branchiostoma belcheri]|uniref:Nephrin-like isoform X2 n=1 Tax=Branchiostoma belcheri TaxID=7741 RepID=A0A6P4ZCH1_BRABE|nr:PREDICTED: nephrin-like isoform X2 [Branchiostoma belcheri]